MSTLTASVLETVKHTSDHITLQVVGGKRIQLSLQNLIHRIPMPVNTQLTKILKGAILFLELDESTGKILVTSCKVESRLYLMAEAR